MIEIGGVTGDAQDGGGGALLLCSMLLCPLRGAPDLERRLPGCGTFVRRRARVRAPDPWLLAAWAAGSWRLWAAVPCSSADGSADLGGGSVFFGGWRRGS